MNGRIAELWVYLAASPLMGLTITLVAYQGAVSVSQWYKNHPLANPVLLSVLALVLLLMLTGTPYDTYFDGAQFVHFLLGPATVALAVPLYAQFNRLKRMALPLLVALIAGSVTAVVTAIVVGKSLGASTATLMSLAPKSVTTPIAMGIAERINGLPSLTSALVILTGIIGAVGANRIFQLARTEDQAIQGFSMGLASHGIGTARSFQISERAGAFSALAMGLNGLLTASFLPWLAPLLLGQLK